MRRRCSALLIRSCSWRRFLPLLVASTPMGARAAARHALAQITKEIHAAVVESARAPTVPTGFTPPLFGDSHAAQWFPALEEIAERRHWRLRTLTKVVCPPLTLPINLPYLDRVYTECEQWRTAAVETLRAERPALVILNMRRFYDHRSWGVQTYGDRWLHALSGMVDTFRAAGSAVLVLGPLPEISTAGPRCAAANPTSLTACNTPRVDAAGIAAERAATEAAGGEYVDVSPLFCGHTWCPGVVSGRLVYVDNGHLTASYVRSLTPVLDAVLDAVPTTPPTLLGGAGEDRHDQG